MSHDLKDVLDRTAVPPRRTLDVEDVRARGRQIQTRRRAARVAVGVGAAAVVVLIGLSQVQTTVIPRINEGPDVVGPGTPGTPQPEEDASTRGGPAFASGTGTITDRPEPGERASGRAVTAGLAGCMSSDGDTVGILLELEPPEPPCVVARPGQAVEIVHFASDRETDSGPATFTGSLGGYTFRLRWAETLAIDEPVSSYLEPGLHTIESDFAPARADVWVLDAPAQSAGEQAVLDALVAFAQDPSDATFPDLPLANTVRLGLGQTLHAAVDAGDLRNPQAWVIDEETYAAFSGPFSAIDRLQAVDPGDLTATAGPHPHCAGPPRPAPDGLDGLRRLSLQGDDDGDPSCIGWFTVDVFVDDDLQIRAVTLDLWEP